MQRKELAEVSAAALSIPNTGSIRIGNSATVEAGIKISDSTKAIEAERIYGKPWGNGSVLLEEESLIEKICASFGLEQISSLFERAVRIDGRSLCHQASPPYASPYDRVALGRAVGVYSSLGSFSILFVGSIASDLSSIKNKPCSLRDFLQIGEPKGPTEAANYPNGKLKLFSKGKGECGTGLLRDKCNIDLNKNAILTLWDLSSCVKHKRKEQASLSLNGRKSAMSKFFQWVSGPFLDFPLDGQSG